ncbi:MAG: UDP-N-acetylmuramate dehydrogenase [Patescibacteria group bacterium]|nr:UDP-N-acetylmuramate dehydrogenase [Patescibacteria group bacterium]MBU1870689.1 UDP-N-acetylmuramate dehydrogenase [Patescibacteria group bacterium]
MFNEKKIIKNKILAPLTTFKIGGPAKFFIEIKSTEDLIEAVNWAKIKKEKINILGGGSNVLINDLGVDGLVIKLSNANLIVDNNELICDAGVSLAQAVRAAIGNNLTGLEWATGIPGTIGGSVYGNAGAFGSNMAMIVKNVEVYDMKNNTVFILSNQQCQFDYRESVFKQKNNLIITKVCLVLVAGQLIEIKKLTNQYLTYRNNSQPKSFSAGSIFKNLTIEYIRSVNQNLAQQAEEAGAVKANKIAASWIIDKLGLKGKQIGFAKISEKHAGFILNNEQAKSQNIIDLINFIKQQAKERYNIQLCEEICYLGF